MLIRSVLIGSFALMAAVSPVSAATITFQDTFAPADNVFMNATSSAECIGTSGLVDTVAPAGSCKTLSFTQELTGYTNPPDVLQSASLSIWIRDDGGGGDGAEKFTLNLDGFTPWTAQAPGNSGPVQFGPVSIFAQVVADGLLSVLLTANDGDFYFVSSILNAEWIENSSVEAVATPEPASLFLFGAGAAFIAFRLRKKSA